MIYSSLAVLALSASAAINPFANLVHLHTRPAQPDTRVSIVLRNNNVGFRDVKIGGHIYTVPASHTVSVKAPVGTVVYAASPERNVRIGDAIVAITPELDHKVITLN